MEQPRFGGEALPPLSISHGEGMSTESITSTMESTRFPIPDLCHVDRVDPDVLQVMEVLHQLGITPHLERHKLRHERQQELDARSVDSGIYCKNLLLKDKKGQAYLIMCEENDTADLQVVKYHLNAQGNLHFASKHSLWKLLQVQPGAISPLALIHSSGDVRVFIDASLVKKINRNSTKLYFHPLQADFQVALTLSQLEAFLHHCDVTLEKLPSLTSYSARRRYSNLTGGCRYKNRSNQEFEFKSKLEETKREDVHDEMCEEGSVLQQSGKCTETMKQTENTFTQHSDLFHQLGIRVETVSAKRNEDALNTTTLPCRSLYLKDKRDNYFLFICHQHQKVDFSTLKMQLKPRKKIVSLDREELWSLLHLQENQEHPFALAQLQQPQFLVALCDNLHFKGNTVLSFPHPDDVSLCLEISLKHLETFINNTSHDLVTIHMKGNIEELQTISTGTVYSSSSKAAKLYHLPQSSDARSKQFSSPGPVAGRYHQPAHDQETVSEFSQAGRDSNLFYHLIAPLREWILRFIRSIVRLLHHYLPSQISAVLSQSVFWNKMLTSGKNKAEDQHEPYKEYENENETEDREKEKMAKTAKLQQLIMQSGIQVNLTNIQSQANLLQDDAEHCITYLLQDGFGRPFIVFCSEETVSSERKLRQLCKAFRLHAVNVDSVSHFLSLPEGSSISWSQEELNPLVLMDIDLSTSGRVRIGMTGAMYLFQDTMLRFDLPSLDVTLWMNSDDLEKMITQLGFNLVYLP